MSKVNNMLIIINSVWLIEMNVKIIIVISVVKLIMIGG